MLVISITGYDIALYLKLDGMGRGVAAFVILQLNSMHRQARVCTREWGHAWEGAHVSRGEWGWA